MRDRLSTKILPNGAVRYGVYDETGTLLRYEYIKLEDEPSVEGDVFSKANMLPDSIPRLLGLKMENPQVKDAFNVLANVGNLHVWERVRILSEPIYKPDESSTNTSITLEPGDILYYSSGVDVVGLEESDISLSEPVSSFSYNGSNFPGVVGKYIRQDGSDLVYYYPTSDQNISGTTLWLRGCKKISATIDTPAGTATDYLTSTDRNAYPDNVTDAKDAYYTLGDVRGPFSLTTLADASWIWAYSNNVIISDDGGTIELNNPSTVSLSRISASTAADILIGKFFKFNMSGLPDEPYDQKIYYIPSDATITHAIPSGEKYYRFDLDKYQPVIGHAAIPANTTITYLGQLGGGARIEVGSYVGTGTYGSNNPCSISFNSVPKMVFLGPGEESGGIVKILWPGETKAGSYYNSSSLLYLTWSYGNKTVSWYSIGSPKHQCNTSGQTYRVYSLI